MRIASSRFGDVDINDERVLRFESGLLGFPEDKRFALLEAGQDAEFWWLQSIERHDLAFVVTDPTLFVPTYEVPIGQPQMEALGLGALDEAQVLVIVNKRDKVGLIAAEDEQREGRGRARALRLTHDPEAVKERL